MAFATSGWLVAFTLIQFCFISGCSLWKVKYGKVTILSSGFEPLPKADFALSSTPMTVNSSPAMLTSLSRGSESPKSSLAVSYPSTTTGERWSSSACVKKRPRYMVKSFTIFVSAVLP